MERRRWDTDDRFTGIASGRALTPAVEQFVAHLDRDGWIAEDPDLHLLPHLQNYCEQSSFPFRLIGTRLHDDGVYELDLEPTEANAAVGLPIRQVLPMLAVVAETSLAVRQVDTNTVECATGMLDGDGFFAGHGHLIRVRIRS